MTNKQFKPHHHYKGVSLSPAEQVERMVVEILLNSKIPDTQRDSSIVWELKHSSGCCQIGRLLAQKRNLNVEIAEIASVLHDIYVIVEGKYKDHGPLGAPIAEKMLKRIGGFSTQDSNTICEAIAHHSEKEIYTEKPYVELVKDVDVLDCSLYKGAQNYYRVNKPAMVIHEYVNRIKNVRKELGLNPSQVWRE